MVNEKKVVQEFLELVRIDSVSGEEREICDLLKKKLAGYGLEVFEDNSGSVYGGNAGNVIARLPASGAVKRPLVLCAHMDTVEPGRGIKPVIDGDMIRSGGDTILGADDKAGIIAILESLRVLTQNKHAHGGIEVVFTVSEETGLLGSKNLNFNKLESKIGYVLDCDGPAGTLVVQAPSQDEIVVVVRGKAAHAGLNPEEGVNAIHAASLAVAGMKLGRIDDETTANIGVISGGRATNIVPDEVIVKGETRSHSAAKRKLQTSSMCAAFEEAVHRLGAQADIKVVTLYDEYKIEESETVLQAAFRAAESVGLTPNLVKSGGGSDANIFNHRGVKMVNLGVGMKKAHTTQEHIRVADLCTNARYLLEIIKFYSL